MTQRKIVGLAIVAAIVFGGLAPRPSALDQVAEGYVKLVLRVGQYDKDYVDAYFGPASWRAEAAAPTSLKTLRVEAARLRAATAAVSTASLSPLSVHRRAFLLSQLEAVQAKLDVLGGARLSYREEARAYYGVRPRLDPLSDFDGELDLLERLIPGPGPLYERVAARRARFAVPQDRLEAVVRAAVAACRSRTAAHLIPPPGEAVTIEIVSGKPWAAYNWYQGGSCSLIQVNTDYPLQIERLLELGCHEAYPGHHLHNTLLDLRLVRGLGWAEFQVYPVNSPFFFIAEGVGDYVPELVFPPAERLAFMRDTLFPLAGLDVAETENYLLLGRAVKRLSAASMTITADYVDGRIDREAAVRLTQRYGLLSRKQAEASVDLMPRFRSYGVNYGLGRVVVRDYVDFGRRRRGALGTIETTAFRTGDAGRPNSLNSTIWTSLGQAIRRRTSGPGQMCPNGPR